LRSGPFGPAGRQGLPGKSTDRAALSLDNVQLELEKLTALAKTAGGKAFKVERPEEIDGIFLQALLRG
jgi:hypothetical protein